MKNVDHIVRKFFPALWSQVKVTGNDTVPQHYKKAGNS